MIEFHKVWIEQCEAARDIREAFGLEKAIGYLVGEKLLNFLETAELTPNGFRDVGKGPGSTEGEFIDWLIPRGIRNQMVEPLMEHCDLRFLRSRQLGDLANRTCPLAGDP